MSAAKPPIYLLMATVIPLGILVLLGTSLVLYLHFNPLLWPGKGFREYVPTYLPRGMSLAIRGSDISITPPRWAYSSGSPVGNYLPPSHIELDIPFGTNSVIEERRSPDKPAVDFHPARVTPRGQKYEFDPETVGGNKVIKPLILFVKDRTEVIILPGPADLTTQEIERMIDSFAPEYKWGTRTYAADSSSDRSPTN